MYYLFSVFKLNTQEAENVIKKIPPIIAQEFRNTFDVARDEGRKEGKIKTKALTSFNSMLLFLADFPNWSDKQIGIYSNLKPTQIKAFRKTLNQNLKLKALQKEVINQFFKTID